MSSRDLSTRAFVSIAQVRGELKRRVFRTLMDVPNRGATCDELERIMGLKHQTLSARVRELWQEGFLKKDGTRPTRSGRLATVYKIRKYRVERQGDETLSSLQPGDGQAVEVRVR